MDVLCFDLGSGGVRGARFDEHLRVGALHDVQWNLHRDAQGRATLVVLDLGGVPSAAGLLLAYRDSIEIPWAGTVAAALG